MYQEVLGYKGLGLRQQYGKEVGLEGVTVEMVAEVTSMKDCFVFRVRSQMNGKRRGKVGEWEGVRARKRI